MKPELIYVDAYDGMVTMKKEDLEALVEKAYQAGWSDSGGGITTPWMVPTTPYYATGSDKMEGEG